MKNKVVRLNDFRDPADPTEDIHVDGDLYLSSRESNFDLEQYAQAYELVQHYLPETSGGHGYTAQCERLVCERFSLAGDSTVAVYSYQLVLSNPQGYRVVIEEGKLTFNMGKSGGYLILFF